MSLLMKVDLVLNVSLLDIKNITYICIYIFFLTLAVRIESVHSFSLMKSLDCVWVILWSAFKLVGVSFFEGCHPTYCWHNILKHGPSRVDQF